MGDPLRESKALVAVAAEEDGHGIGRIRLWRIPDASAASLMPFVKDSIEPGNVIHTDGWLGYLPLKGGDYRQVVTFLTANCKAASELMPRVHLVMALRKRWPMGTH